METKKALRLLPLITGMFICFSSCSDDDPDPILPSTLTTLSVSDITETSAKSGGNITDDGGGEINSKGLVWSTNSNPSLENHIGITEEGPVGGTFTSSITGLSPETAYYVRAYATNSAGTSFGNDVMFETLPEEDEIIYGQAIDVDGNLYTTVFLGQQEWFAENLRVGHYSDGSSITSIGYSRPFSVWIEQSAGATTLYPYEQLGISLTEFINTYGRLYNWYATVDERGLCPTGWRVPTDGDFTELRNFIILNYDEITKANISQALKSCRQVNSPLGGLCATNIHPRWNEYENYGTDQFGVSIIPSGGRNLDPDLQPGMVGNGYTAIGFISWFWTSSETDANRPITYVATNRSDVFTREVTNPHYYPDGGGIEDRFKNRGYSIRCVRNVD